MSNTLADFSPCTQTDGTFLYCGCSLCPSCSLTRFAPIPKLTLEFLHFLQVGTYLPQCEFHPECAGLEGPDCCPTADGVYLECCERDFAQCKAHPECAHLDGDCCPTTSGIFLVCGTCLTTSAVFGSSSLSHGLFCWYDRIAAWMTTRRMTTITKHQMALGLAPRTMIAKVSTVTAALQSVSLADALCSADGFLPVSWLVLISHYLCCVPCFSIQTGYF